MTLDLSTVFLAILATLGSGGIWLVKRAFTGLDTKLEHLCNSVDGLREDSRELKVRVQYTEGRIAKLEGQ